MSYEVDIRAVGDESQSGDAIVFRYGNLTGGAQQVVVVDGGFKDSGTDLVNFIRQYYRTSRVDLVVSTHPDNDHISGLEVVLEELSVGELWMHRPWRHAEPVRAYVEQQRITARQFSDRLRKSLEAAYELEKRALKKNIPIREPFQGLAARDGRLVVIGPSETYYNSLVAQFGEAAPAATISPFLERLLVGVRGVAQRIYEIWSQDGLVEPAEDAVSPRNNASVVLLALLDDDFFLFTADAGVPALKHAATYVKSRGQDLRAMVKFLQVPHHGSKRNIGPSVLNELIGPVVAEGGRNGKRAFISAARKGEPKHPSKRVSNALIRRGTTVTVTQGISHSFRSLDVPPRPNWGPIPELQFSHQYDEETE